MDIHLCLKAAVAALSLSSHWGFFLALEDTISAPPGSTPAQDSEMFGVFWSIGL
jgi:hypothetical protein